MGALVQDTLEPDAFRKLYPDQYYARFVAEGLRPDGRPLLQARPTTIALGAVSAADSSALVKIGNTTVMAGIKLEVMVPVDERPQEGQVAVSVELTALCSPDARPGRFSEAAHCLNEQVSTALRSGGVVNLQNLLIAHGRAAWVAYLDLYVLDADGGLYDAALLAALAALAALRLPHVDVDDEGKVVPAGASDAAMVLEDADGQRLSAAGPAGPQPIAHLRVGSLPTALTCALYNGQLIVDPDRDEEARAHALVAVTVDDRGRLLGVEKQGGRAAADAAALQSCIAAARVRHREVASLLRQALHAATVPGYSGADS
ncbi:hypothetical protein WJX81_007772 [Elliptochloris bilobata]|uniref:Ribosomal RNA-processing protein 43 n=1 Tax=Elliptochloris bilobata TaxID=381761 RepID=A0AAW1RLE6_9CHLO